ncbi:TATA box-binding protein-associated factor RNA polymerase I subunit C [Bufo gargarizans]|uniref:TATA box-binding protein-associated factor RNA polymerase I subunit C n=1 Tax=Bufo gargarizans TaxID=30331 RepID=UPI001CF46293|nr:TATA box-binding protein-associated factor RNA polymerase I subunit C [Bufo gargarizans]
MELPCTRFPGYFLEGPTNRETPVAACVLGYGEDGGVVESVRDPDKGCGSFIPLYSRTRQTWTTGEALPFPLLSPNRDCSFAPVTESDLVCKKTRFLRHTNQNMAGVTLSFSKQMGRFCWDHNSIAFQCMGQILEPHCHLGDTLLTGKSRRNSVRMTNLMQSLQTTPFQDCPYAHTSSLVRSFSYLACDWLQDVPPGLLAELVNEGMAEDWKTLQFQASLTGGALSWTSYPGTSYGCLIYPRGAAMNQLYFQQLLLDQSDGLGVKLQGDPAVYELKGRIEQVSAGHHEQTLVGVRASFHLASWSFSADDPPKPLSVLSTRTPSTCINASPHIAGEFCVCTESGTLYLWSVESGLQLVRQDPNTLFFRDDPNWRWSDFTSHPRVLTFADRTGVQLADIRVPNSQGQELFRIGQESSCRRGERVILPRCLRETNPAYCLVSTQFSLYIMDDRFPLVPLARWDHMLEAPPTYISIIPGVVTDHCNKILLGTQHSQETLMVQYSGGSSSSCQLHLPAVCLPRISDSLNYLDPLLPHQHDTVLQRLQFPLAGLAAASLGRAEDHLLVFQLTAAGDLFVQRLVQDAANAPSDSCSRPTTLIYCNSEEPAAVLSQQSVPEDEVVNHCPESIPEDTRPSRSLKAESTTMFCRWLHDLYNTETRQRPIVRPVRQIHRLFPFEKVSESAQEADSLRERLRESMRRGVLLPSPAEATSGALEGIHPESWKDPLSQRLTASWEERLGLWWDDQLGTNLESKIQALREKQRRRKLLRSRSRSTLTGSFTASITSDPYETDPCSPWSCSGAPEADTPADLPLEPSIGQDYSADEASQMPTTSRLCKSSAVITSSQSLQAKGIPHERRQTLRDFLSFLGDSETPRQTPPPTASQSQTLSQRSQPPSKRSRMGF